MITGISNWILSIAGIVCLSVLVELLLPEGQMNRYIKGIFAFLIMLIVVAPIPKLLNKEINFTNIFNYDNYIQVDEDYLYQINLNKLSFLQEEIEKDIKKLGYKNVKVYINCNVLKNELKYKSISVDLKSLVISESAEHKNITKIREDISKVILSFIDIGEEDILYDT